MKVALGFGIAVLASACASPRSADDPGHGRHSPSTSDSTSSAEAPIEATPGEPFELRPDDAKLTLAFEGGEPLCAGRTKRAASGKYVVDFTRRTVTLSGTDACGRPFRRSSLLPASARARIEDLVAATKTPKESVAYGEKGEIAQARITMVITRRDGQGARFGVGTPDPHEGHGQRMRAYLDSLVH